MLDRRLSYFLAIVDQGSFRAASQVAGVTQPALTRAIRELEKEVGVTLFQRLPRGVSLTAAGHMFEKRVRALALEERHARSELEALRSGRRPVLRIGAAPSWSYKYLPGAVARLQNRHYSLKTEVRFGLKAGLHTLLEAGDLDLCFGAIDDLVLDPTEFQVEQLVTSTVTAFVRGGHPLASQRPAQAVDLLPWPWIIYTGDHQRVAEINRRLQEQQLPPIMVSFEMNSITMASNIAMRSDAVLCLSTAFTGEASRYGLLPVPIGIGEFASGAWFRHEKERAALIRELLIYVRSEIEKEIDPLADQQPGMP